MDRPGIMINRAPVLTAVGRGGRRAARLRWTRNRYYVPINPDLDAARAAMARLAVSVSPEDLRLRAFKLYEVFRPNVPPGERGWGASGVLDA